MLKCLRCGHEWEPRTSDRPRTCPCCKSYRYDEPLRRPKP